jgi:hypothetical protein
MASGRPFVGKHPLLVLFSDSRTGAGYQNLRADWQAQQEPCDLEDKERAMESIEIVRYRDEFYPAGFRKVFALVLVVSVTVLPELFSWVGTPVERPAARTPTGRFGPSGGFLPERQQPRSNVLHILWSFIKRSVVLLITTLGVALYYPRPGFKRYSLLCGPLIALIVPTCIAVYLQGRTEVFRAEILIVSLVALLPGIGLYVLLTWRKAQRLGMAW